MIVTLSVFAILRAPEGVLINTDVIVGLLNVKVPSDLHGLVYEPEVADVASGYNCTHVLPLPCAGVTDVLV